MNLTITLPVDAANLVISALGKLPYDKSAPVINEIMKQVNQQILEANAAIQAQQAAANAEAAPAEAIPETELPPRAE